MVFDQGAPTDVPVDLGTQRSEDEQCNPRVADVDFGGGQTMMHRRARI
jgi:hypothetical protein